MLNADYGESTYRKKFQCFEKMFQANQKLFSSEEDLINEFKEQRRELEEEKVKFRDERNAWNMQNRVAARVSQKLDYLDEKISEIGKVEFENTESKTIINSDNDLLVCLSDAHIGASFDGIFGTYNSDIAKDKLDKYLQEILTIQKRHNSQKAYVTLMGDEISGSIHRSIQVTNRENVIEQIKLASELIGSFCFELSKHFQTVFISSVGGNHSRLQKKDEALKDERLDDLIEYIVGTMVAHIDNIHMLSHRKLDNTVVDLIIRGKTYLAVHGDYDNATESGLMRLCSMIGIFPYAVLMGHRHTPAYSEINGVKIVQTGSLCGSGDDYTISKRLYGKANQTVCVCNSKGIECIYNVELN